MRKQTWLEGKATSAINARHVWYANLNAPCVKILSLSNIFEQLSVKVLRHVVAASTTLTLC